MARLRRDVGRAADGSTVRLFLLLLVGAMAAAAVTFLALQVGHHRGLKRAHEFTTAERIGDLAQSDDDPAAGVAAGLPPARGQRLGPPDAALTQAVAAALDRRGVSGVTVRAYEAADAVCGADPGERLRCRILTLTPDGGPAMAPVAVSLPAAPRPWSLGGESAALLAAGLAAVIATAWLASHRAAAPLARLSAGALALGRDLDRPPLVEEGAREVRQAAAALNVMQTRLRAMIAERTRVLAAVAHDLQTPLTRMRLRVEKIGDDGLRAQLIADLAAMQHLVREGLDLARIETAPEPVVPVDLDALLSALCEDAADAGQPVVFAQGCGAVLPTRPQALRRCLTNLIDNAVRHGGGATVSAMVEGTTTRLAVRDHGPGVPEDRLEALFEPFYRLDPSRSRDSGGTGLGLTIARRMAEVAGGRLTLANAGDGGLEAVVAFDAP
ncbi:MAG: sensor histidine kinase [Brevundimonas mediterranea]|jgi:signal transduction histidine kinase|uniref:histidine kinase n=4 Tax=Brevundimonas TaxID=41275 RepID=A0AB37E4H1_9CAUL|nr:MULTISPECIES: HAMP domain-containing sensor histidine kinase [Brevundimonas]EDX81387.1 ATPase, histidine kinase-, DNA gyrase B-, and HSP90-like domain protein [Brevundimonas sp. BAL3]MBA4332026.1 sensor histidine kinase [Brevundimonas sp.]QIH72238.1 HAMP domain-containing histidine kinase [Brevundimonas mediterranea]